VTRFAQRFGACEHVRDVVVSGDCERALRVDDVGVEGAEPHTNVLLEVGQLGALGAASFFARSQRVELASGEVQRDRAELGHESVMPARGVGLALQRPKTAPDLAQQVGEAEQIALGRLEPALRLLAPLAELEDPGGFFDDRPAFFRPSVQHGVELTLAHDDVLLAADAGVGQQFLDVEKSTRCAVDHVLGVAGAEQRARDRDLGELDRQQPGAVVDRERHLGAAERRAVGRAGEDDVVHLGAAQCPRALGAEDPGHGVDDIRLARAVRTHDDTHAGLELERGLVGEGFETLQRE
jgi:hypothetical protein